MKKIQLIKKENLVELESGDILEIHWNEGTIESANWGNSMQFTIQRIEDNDKVLLSDKYNLIFSIRNWIDGTSPVKEIYHIQPATNFYNKKKVKCDKCSCLDIELSDAKYVCIEEKHDLSVVEDIENYEVECDLYESKHLQYPFTVYSINYPKDKAIAKHYRGDIGELVKVRPSGENYGNKTFLGILLGNADIGLYANYNQNSKELSLGRMYNPAIFVPELKEIIYGYESWWGLIKSKDDLKDITSDEIQNLWYVKMLHSNKSKIE